MIGRQFSVEVQYAPVNVVMNAARASVSPPVVRSWMHSHLQPWFANQIVNTFAYQGRGETWPPPSSATLDIRRRRGILSTDANIAEGGLVEYLATHYDVSNTALGMQLTIPGDVKDRVTQIKLRTAQFGQENVDMFGQDDDGDHDIPARPVLTMTQADRSAVVRLLQDHVINFVSGGLQFRNIGSL